MMVGKSLRVLVGASVVVALGLVAAPRRMEAQDPAPPDKKRDGRQLPVQVFVTAGKPAAPAEIEIPDDPPPHEGAMFSLPNRVDAPDIIQVEVLEALPGRPIGGERLVRPDGTISLGFYGDIHVVGLTTVEIKEKVINHLRSYLTDEALGLWAEMASEAELVAPNPAPPAPPAVPRAPNDLPPLPNDGDDLFRQKPPEAPPKPKKTTTVVQSEARTKLARLANRTKPQPLRQPAYKIRDAMFQEPKAPQLKAPERSPATPPGARVPQVEDFREPAFVAPPNAIRPVRVAPKDSDRVLVDIASYNSKVYFVLGDVNQPGRLPWTGRETVLDALQFAGGLDPSADAKNVRLVRPAHGKKPAKVYHIDLAAIQDRGDATANLQLFPGDRLVVGRSAVTESTIKLNADAARTNTLMNSALVYGCVLRTLDRLGETGGANTSSELSIKLNGQTLKINLGDDAPRVDPARRKAALKAFEEYWSKTARAGGQEEARLIEEMMKLLDK